MEREKEPLTQFIISSNLTKRKRSVGEIQMKISTKRLVINSLMIALVFLVTMLIRIPSPIPGGYFNLGDAIIMMAAILVGRRTGMIAGAIGAALADLATGYLFFAPITFLVKGIEGYVVGLIADKSEDDTMGMILKLISVVVGAIIIVAGYFILEMCVLRFIDETLAVTAIVAEVPGNIIQGAASAVIAFILATILGDTPIKQKLN